MKFKLEVILKSAKGIKCLNQTFFEGEVELPNYLSNIRIFPDGTAVSNYSEIFNNTQNFVNFLSEIKYMIHDKLKKTTQQKIHENYDVFGVNLRMNRNEQDIQILVTALDYPVYDNDGNLTGKKIQKVIGDSTFNGSFYEPSDFYLKKLSTVFNDIMTDGNNENVYTSNFAIPSFNMFS